MTLNKQGICAQRYVDDILILIRDMGACLDVMTTALDVMEG